MGGIGRRVLGLCLPPLVFCILDGAVTLLGQSVEYWSGDYVRVNEASPTFNHLLQIHPAVYVFGILVWAVVFVGIILLLPDTLALIVSIAVTFGHTVGAATWLLYRFHFGYQACNGLFLLSAVLLGLCIRLGGRASPAQEYRLPDWPPIVRWVLVAVLFGVGMYLFLWPRSS